jgi:hypothetical protein
MRAVEAENSVLDQSSERYGGTLRQSERHPEGGALKRRLSMPRLMIFD